jgi:hypothetical protein
VRLAAVPDPDLAREVVRSMAAKPDSAYVPTLVQLLGDRACREDAHMAILALGERALEPLEQALSDTTLPRELRRHLPRTLSLLASPLAARILERRLGVEPDETVEAKIVRALGRLRAAETGIAVDTDALLLKARSTLERAVTLLFWRVAIEQASELVRDERSVASSLLTALLSDKESDAVDRVFRLLKVVDPAEDFDVLLAGLRSSDPRRRENGRELLAHVVSEPLRGGILALLGDGTPLARLRHAARFHDPAGRSRLERALSDDGTSSRSPEAPLAQLQADLLGEMLLDPSEAIRAVARHVIGELGLARPESVDEGSGAFSGLSEPAQAARTDETPEISRAG